MTDTLHGHLLAEGWHFDPFLVDWHHTLLLTCWLLLTVLTWSQAYFDRKMCLFWQKHFHKAFVANTILVGVWRLPDDFRCSQQTLTGTYSLSELFSFLKLRVHQKSFDGSGIKLLSCLSFTLSFFLFPLPSPSGLPRSIYWLFALDCHWDNDTQTFCVALFCTGQIFYILFLTAALRFWSFRLNTFRDSISTF